MILNSNNQAKLLRYGYMFFELTNLNLNLLAVWPNETRQTKKRSVLGVFTAKDNGGSKMIWCYFNTAWKESLVQIDSTMHIEKRGCDINHTLISTQSDFGYCMMSLTNEYKSLYNINTYKYINYKILTVLHGIHKKYRR